MAPNVDQHKTFLPALERFENHVKEIYEGKIQYQSVEFLSLIDDFADPLMEHLNDVRSISSFYRLILHLIVILQEIATLDATRLKEHFTAEELRSIDQNLEKLIVAHASVDKTLPLFLVTHDASIDAR